MAPPALPESTTRLTPDRPGARMATTRSETGVPSGRHRRMVAPRRSCQDESTAIVCSPSSAREPARTGRLSAAEARSMPIAANGIGIGASRWNRVMAGSWASRLVWVTAVASRPPMASIRSISAVVRPGVPPPEAPRSRRALACWRRPASAAAVAVSLLPRIETDRPTAISAGTTAAAARPGPALTPGPDQHPGRPVTERPGQRADQERGEQHGPADQEQHDHRPRSWGRWWPTGTAAPPRRASRPDDQAAEAAEEPGRG